MENDTNHENNKMSKLKLYQYAEGISVSNSKTVERAGRTNRDMKKATTEAIKRSKLHLENGKLRWLDTVFQGQYLPSLSINYIAINKVLDKLPPQLY